MDQGAHLAPYEPLTFNLERATLPPVVSTFHLKNYATC